MSQQPQDKAAALKVAISASVSMAVMIADFAWLMRDEFKYVWPGLRSSWSPRVYMFARYIGMASQIFNVYFTVRMYLGVHTSPTGCRLWFAYQALVIQFLLAVVEGLLMHRIYALFLRNKLILLILLSFALGQIASMWVSASLSFPSNKHTTTCLLVKSNPGNAFFSTTTMTTNIAVFFMTFWRYLRLPAKWAQQGLGRIIFRDIALSLGAISAIMLFMTLCSLGVIHPSVGGNVTYFWFVCILWISVGRIVVNHEKLPRDGNRQGEGTTWKGTLQFTSQIEMGEDTLTHESQCVSSPSSGRHTPMTSTFRSSPSTPVGKTGRFSPSTVYTDDGVRWLGDHLLHSGHGGNGYRHSLEPSTAESPEEMFVPDTNRLSSSDGNSDAPRTANHPPADEQVHAHEDGHNPSRSPSPRLPRPEPPLLKVPP